MLTGYGNIPTAVAAIKQGAIDYLSKPADADDVERALLADPDLLLLDESTSNLDTKSKKLVYDILNDLDITIVNSTHSSEELINYDVELKLSQSNEITIVEEIKL